VLIQADARHLPLRDGCVNCCVTSPPYWGLRDYGVSGQLGLEPTPDAYVANLVAVFREVRRVLRDDGTVWLNLGDSYAGSGMTGGTASKDGGAARVARMFHGNRRDTVQGLAQKQLIGIPWRVAFALQADGWYLRSDIIWSKPNPMPESVRDRPTRAHEYIFLLTKSERYWYDAAAIREPYAPSTLTEFDAPYNGEATKDYAAAGVQNPSSIKRRITDKQRGHSRRHAGFNDRWDSMSKAEQGRNGANKRTVWTIGTHPFPEAHFATFPEKLIEPCILAGCPMGGLVLDPFIGSGTTGVVASRLGRRWVGCDLTYFDISKRRTAQRGLTLEVANA
jgi:DNA modification methylase